MNRTVFIIISAAALFLFFAGNFPEKILNYCEAKLDIKDKYTYDKNYLYQVRKDQHMSYKIQADIVMLGDSMTEFAEWNELLGRNDVVNRGISGDITEGMLNRTETVLKVKPKICFFMGGINDIIRRISYEKIKKNIYSIVDELNQNEIKPVIFSIIYTGREYSENEKINTTVKKLNSELKSYAKEKTIDYMDINAALSPEGFLKDEYTYDGLHLNAEGYKIWASFLKKYLKAVLDQEQIDS